MASGSLRFSPDSGHLIYAGGGTCATIWEWQKTQPTQPVLASHGATVRSIAFDQDAGRAVTGSDDGTAVIWNIETGAPEFKLKDKDSKPGAGVPSAEFSADGRKVIVGGSFQEAGLWDASNGSLRRQLNFDTHAIVIGDTIRIGVSRQGNRAVTFSSNGWGVLWDLKTEKQLKSLHTENGASVRDVWFARDGSEFVVADASGFAFVFDSLRGELKRRVGRQGVPLLAAEIAPRDDEVLTGDDNGQITVWRMADGRDLQNINSAPSSPRVNDVHFSPDGVTIIAACADNKVRTWNALTGEPMLIAAEETVPSEINFPVALRADIANGTAIHPGMLRVQYSPDGSFFAGTNESGNILIWDAKRGKQLLRLQGHTMRVTSLAFSSSGSLLGSSSEDGTARIWDVGLENRSPTDIKRRLAGIRQKFLR
jgi:WD40 repeat protein